MRKSFSTFWEQNPALFLGLSILLGTSLAFHPHPLLAILCIALLCTARSKGSRLVALLCIVIAFGSASLRHPNIVLAQEKIEGKGCFHIHQVKISSSPFNRSILYSGVLSHFQTIDGQTLKNLPCHLYLPLYKKRMPANTDYEIEGTLLQKRSHAFVLKPKKEHPWKPISSFLNLAEWRFNLKQAVFRYLKKEIKDPHAQTFLNALATGEIDERILSMEFGKVGLQHILAISGFHFALATLFLKVVLYQLTSLLNLAYRHLRRGIYPNDWKNREFDKEAPQNFCSERVTIAERQGTSENENDEVKPTQSKTDSSSRLGIKLHQLFSDKTHIICLLIAISFYYLFLGNAPSIQRAYIAFFLIGAGQLFSLRISGLNALGVGLIVELFLNPLVVTELGFQLTFLCTLAILLCYPVADDLLKFLLPKRNDTAVKSMSLLDKHGYLLSTSLRKACALNFAVHFMTLPALLYLFHKFPLLSLAYNLFFPLCVSFSMLLLLTAFLFAPWLPFLSHLIHLLNNAWTSTLLNFTSHPPTFLDFYLRSKDISFSFVICFLAISFTVGIIFYTKDRSTT